VVHALRKSAAFPNLSGAARRGRAESADPVLSKKRKAFKTSPSVRIPRAAVEKLQESKAQAQAQAQAIQLQAAAEQVVAMGNALERAIDAYARRHAMHFDALRDLMRYFDKVNASGGDWTVADVKRIEEIRLLSIGV
jgi:hypothetical protein